MSHLPLRPGANSYPPPSPGGGKDPIDGAQLAGEWGNREAFVAVVTTNLPMIFHLLRSWLTRLFGTAFGSSEKTYKFPSGFQTIGGGAGESSSRKRRAQRTVHPISANLTFSESEERIVDNVKMNDLEAFGAPSTRRDHSPGGIVVSNQVEITHEDRNSHLGESDQPRGGNW